MRTAVDHLVFATAQLHEGVEYMEQLLGLSASAGGAHPGIGTRNALLALGAGCYLEVIGPDPEQADFPGSRPFGIDTLSGVGQLAGWAARRPGLSDFIKSVNDERSVLSEVLPLSRHTPAGDLLEWQLSFLTNIDEKLLQVLPFFIDWGATPHPSTQCAGDAVLVRLEIECPQPPDITPLITLLELDVAITKADEPGIRALIACPNGEVELRTPLS